VSEFDNPELFRTILETLPTGVYLVDRNRKILFWNEGAEEITGYLRQDVVGRFLRDHLLTVAGDVKKDLESDPADPLSIAFRDGKPSSGEVSILHKEGYRVPIVLRTIPIRNVKSAVIGAVECFERNFSAFERTRRQIAAAALGSLDLVTGVPNRAYMEAHLQECLATFQSDGTRFSILVMETDRMDHFRASCGPGVATNIHRVVAQTVANSLRPTDTIGCWSEHQFVILLPNCRESMAGKVGERIRKIVAKSEIEWWGDEFFLTASFGGAGCREEDTLELLIERAEKSLTESIAAGGNRVTARLHSDAQITRIS
jgi:diguanylate cyclase (GGDEF)-like protein/PAS domain S-box-containing protein